MADNEKIEVRFAVLEERVDRLLSDAEGRAERADALFRDVGDDAREANKKAAASLAKAEEASGLAKTSGAQFSRLVQWGTVIAAALAGLFAFSWWDAPRQARALIDERVAEAVDPYIESGEVFENLRYQVEQDGNLLVFRSGSIESDEWVKYRETGLYADVRLDLSGFENRRIFLSLSGTSGNWELDGPTAYPLWDAARNNPALKFNDDGFSVFLHHVDTTADLVEMAKNANWRVDWLVVGSAEPD